MTSRPLNDLLMTYYYFNKIPKAQVNPSIGIEPRDQHIGILENTILINRDPCRFWFVIRALFKN